MQEYSEEACPKEIDVSKYDVRVSLESEILEVKFLKIIKGLMCKVMRRTMVARLSWREIGLMTLYNQIWMSLPLRSNDWTLTDLMRLKLKISQWGI